ncbi:membrane protein, conserved [Thermococcus sp. 4557]|uniref:LPXTG cell wall anchor domain-containing protein n=1 Tax=Thermococcus sp. (strain CGMCC 1.5172 / 4557) TaxID=1042877 RepID=UPI000219EEA6|nr:LPXTG cell wall anchor domain-containing protein [Thermococcus sp. 4557]AEK73647.1 membrane protein, conserved [Thermococcus sp. 4557]
MRGILAVGVLLMLIVSTASGAEAGSAEIMPYVYEPTVPDTAFSVLAFYENGDYARVLEGCEWLMMLKTPFDSWGFAQGEEHEAKYTAMAMMALMRGERVARGRYNSTLNSAAYWLIYTQNPDGSWGDYTDTALALIALREFLNGYINENLTGFEKQVGEAVDRATGWLMGTEPKTDTERIFGYMALGKREELEKMEVSGELEAYRAFALAYLGEGVELDGNFKSTVALAMALYATLNGKYREELLQREHFGFWGTLHYRVLDLLSVSKIGGFENLRPTACPYLSKVHPTDDWERVILADYYLLCNITPELPSNLSALLPWQVAELARVKALMGEDYSAEVSYLLSTSENGVWKDFYNTEYVVWVFRTLNMSYDYSKSLDYLSKNLTWMLSTKDPKTGNPVYYNTPTYYFAYALLVFRSFGMERELNKTLNVLAERQYENGAFPYTQGSIAGITSTAKAVWALHEAGLTDTELYEKGVSFLRSLLYAEIPSPEVGENAVSLANATFLLVRDGSYAGNSTGRAELTGLDGYVVIYPSKNPLVISAEEVNGFRAVEPATGDERTAYFYIAAGVALIALAVVVVRRGRRGGRK